MTGPVLQYARWQLRDHLKGTGRVIAVAAVVIGVLLWRLHAENPTAGQGADAAMTGFLSSLGWPLVVLATAGIVSTDRVDGYNRALFSAPISPVLYYLQRWLIGWLVVLTLPAVLAVSFRLALGAWVDPLPYTKALALIYLLLGSLVFCWSTFGRRDWAVAIALYLVEPAVQDAVARGMPVPAMIAVTNRYLPPFHLVDFGQPLQPGVVLPTGWHWAHYLGYALALLVIGLLILRVRPTGSGVRG